MKTIIGTLLLALAAVRANGETFTATAEAKNASGTVRTAPVTITYSALSTPAERDALSAALKSGGHAAMKKVLATMKEIGSIQAGKRTVAVKYAFARKVGSGRAVTVVAAEPMGALKADLSNGEPRAGYDLTLALLVLDAADKGTGEFTPAAKVMLRDDGAFATEDATTETIWLRDVAKK